MSHFSVAVFTSGKEQSVHKLLEPYKFILNVPDNLKDTDIDEFSYMNPDTEFDEYVIGGRWKKLLVLKESAKAKYIDDASEGCNTALVRDIDFEAMCNRELFTGEEMHMRSSFEEENANWHFSFCTRAVITPDGQWHTGKAGPFGYVCGILAEEWKWKYGYQRRFIKPALEKGWYVTIVDCHI